MAAKKTNNALPVAASADELIGAADKGLGEETVALPALGFSIRIRGLTRGETRAVLDADELDATGKEARALSLAAVEPTFTEEQALKLIGGKTFGATEAVLTKVLELSGLTPGFRS